DELHDALMLLALMTRDEVQRAVHHESNGAGAEQLLNELIAAKRATQLRARERTFWITAERLPMLRAIYENADVDPAVVAPEAAQKQNWERTSAIRELLRGRMEVSGPVRNTQLQNILGLSQSEIETGFLGLEGEG